ncbi:hypothetical protein K2173_000891 [Erythroxylum novogranatense]|uniref:Uncharacterized protein n=1 Tax=Erythroxylum novogranatense TaxID=1862640 RepID=A0AAV8TQC3_9ROSI|nr:hypothetical protein K2173_000891 [Erythroxylum novogranatense]
MANRRPLVGLMQIQWSLGLSSATNAKMTKYLFMTIPFMVGMACVDNKGHITTSREQTTGWFGKYAIRFDGTPDLSNCYVQVSSKNVQNSNGCTVSTGPAQKLRLILLMSYCPRSTTPVPAAVTSARATNSNRLKFASTSAYTKWQSTSLATLIKAAPVLEMEKLPREEI